MASPRIRLVLRAVLLVLGALIVVLPSAAFAQTGVLDQTCPNGGSAQFNRDSTALIWQAQTHAGASGQLEGVRLFAETGNANATLHVRIRKGAAPSVQPVLVDVLVTKAVTGAETLFADMKTANIFLTANEIYVIEIQGTGTGVFLRGSYTPPPGAPLCPDPLFLNGTKHADGGWRIAFQTFRLNCTTGMACNDNDPCTTNDVCGVSGCAGTPVVCMASDPCHDAGTCDPSSGVCSNPPVMDGKTCDDNDLCTKGDVCTAGSCAGAAVTCTPLDDCHVAGACDPMTGACSDPPAVDGTTCDDQDPCTMADSCQAGQCAATAVACPPPANECLEAGVCGALDGMCTYAEKADGTPCAGGTCKVGVCVPTASTSAASTSAATTSAATTSSTGAGASTGAGGQGGQGGGSGTATPNGGGCDCSTSTDADPRHGLAALALGLAAFARVRRSRRRA
ncbi:MAG: MYXO-CTERM sorting domain-containing protein [Polyangiaceae bacterium]